MGRAELYFVVGGIDHMLTESGCRRRLKQLMRYFRIGKRTAEEERMRYDVIVIVLSCRVRK